MKWMQHKAVQVVGALIFIVWAAISCGGGGSENESGGGSTHLTPATINRSTAEQATAMAIAAQTLRELNADIDFQPTGSGQSSALKLGGRIWQMVKSDILSNTDGYKIAGQESTPKSCPNSGSVSISTTWDGPNDPTDCSQVSNVNATLQFSDCQKAHLFLSGTVYVQTSGSLCKPTGISLRFADMTLSDENEWFSAIMTDFRLNYTFVWSDNDIAELTVVLNGDAAASFDSDSFDMEFNNFSLSVAQSDANTSLSINGALTGTCLDGWVTFETLSPVIVNDAQDCPISGNLRITGNGEMTVTFNPNGSVDIGDTHYDSCKDLPHNC